MKYRIDSLGIEVEVIEGCGKLIGTLKTDKRHSRYNAAIAALESVILSHACAGVNVCEGKYVSGIQTTLDAIENNLGD